MSNEVDSGRLAGVIALYREQADAVPVTYPVRPGEFSQHKDARAALPRSLRFAARLLEEATSPIEEEELRDFIELFGLGISQLDFLLDPSSVSADD